MAIDLTADELDLLRRAPVELTAEIDGRLTEGLRGRHRDERQERQVADLEATRRLAVRLMELPGFRDREWHFHVGTGLDQRVRHL